MLIVCTVPGLEDETAEPDRETDLWWEKDYPIYGGGFATAIYPKLHWRAVDYLIVPVI